MGGSVGRDHLKELESQLRNYVSAHEISLEELTEETKSAVFRPMLRLRWNKICLDSRVLIKWWTCSAETASFANRIKWPSWFRTGRIADTLL